MGEFRPLLIFGEVIRTGEDDHFWVHNLALAVDVLPDETSAAKDLGVFNIAGALPFSVAPAIAPAILSIGNGSYAVLYAVAGVSALLGAAAIVPVKGVR